MANTSFTAASQATSTPTIGTAGVMTSAGRQIAAFLGVLPGEGRRVGWMVLYSMGAVGGVVLTGQVIGRALFLSSLPREAVPLKFLFPPLALVVATGLYTRLAARQPIGRLIVGLCTAAACGAALFWYVLDTRLAESLVLLSVLYVFLDVSGALIIIQYWTLAGDIFDAREAKRLFAVISTGGVLSAILFGALLSGIAGLIAPRHLLWLFIASLLVCAWSAAAVTRGQRGEEALRDDRAGRPSDQDGRGAGLRSSPLLLAMAGVLILVAMVSSIADFQLDLAMQAAFGGDGARMVGFLGSLRFWTGVVALFFQLFVTARILERFGVATGLLLLPMGIALGSVGILLSGGLLWTVLAPRAVDQVLKFTINDSTFNLLYLPVRRDLRARAKVVLDGMVKPVVLSALGLVFLLVVRAFPNVTVVDWSLPALALVGLWASLVLRLRRLYVAELAETIRLRRFDTDAIEIDCSDESRSMLARTLREGDELRALYALGVLEQLPNVDWTLDLRALLERPERQIRLATLAHLERRAAAEDGEAIRPHLAAPDNEVRAAAARALCAAESRAAIESVRPLLGDESLDVQAGAVIGLTRYTGLDGLIHAVGTLKRLLESAHESERTRGAWIIGELGIPTFYDPLVDALADASLAVRQSALQAAARLGAEDLVPHLLPALEDPTTHADAAAALGACAGDGARQLVSLLRAPDATPTARETAARLLGAQGSLGAADALAQLLDVSQEALRAAAAEALLAMRARGIAVAVDAERLRTTLDLEIATAFRLERARAACDATADGALLRAALADRASAAGRRVIVAVGLRFPDLPVTAVQASLDQDAPRLRANAIELIDNLVPSGAHKESLLTLLGPEGERESGAARVLRTPAPAPSVVLGELATCPDPWLRACALFTLARTEPDSGRASALAACRDDDPLVRETAQFVLGDGRQGGSAMPLSTLEKVLFLRGVSLFEKIPVEQLARIVPIAREVRYDAGATVMRQGEAGTCLCVIVEGELRVERGGQEVARLSTRDIIGELAVLSEQPRSADCTALTETLVLEIDKGDFLQLLSTSSAIALGIVKELVARYASAPPVTGDGPHVEPVTGPQGVG